MLKNKSMFEILGSMTKDTFNECKKFVGELKEDFTTDYK